MDGVDTTLDMPLDAYVSIAAAAGFEVVLRTPFARTQVLRIRGRQERLGDVEETLCILGRRDGFLLVLESYTGSSGTPVVNMAELNYRFRQGPHHETAAEFETYKIPFPDPLAENERVYHAVVAGLGERHLSTTERCASPPWRTCAWGFSPSWSGRTRMRPFPRSAGEGSGSSSPNGRRASSTPTVSPWPERASPTSPGTRTRRAGWPNPAA
jgi:hypothetical protein